MLGAQLYYKKYKKINDLMIKIYKEYFKMDYKTFNYFKGKNIECEFKSYSRWAMDEIQQELIHNVDKDPLNVLENLKNRFNMYAAISKTNECNFLFSVACDTCQFVIDEFMVLEEDQNE